MGLTYGYLSAPSDAAAAAVVTRDGGPEGDMMFREVETTKRGWFSRTKTVVELVETQDTSLPLYDTAPDGLDPFGTLPALEELLTGRPLQQIQDDPDFEELASANEGERLVVRINRSLPAALIATAPERLPDVARALARSEHFGGDDLAVQIDVLTDDAVGADRGVRRRRGSCRPGRVPDRPARAGAAVGLTRRAALLLGQPLTDTRTRPSRHDAPQIGPPPLEGAGRSWSKRTLRRRGPARSARRSSRRPRRCRR